MNESELSDADRRALVFIRSFSSKRGRPPTYVEIGKHLRLPYPNNANRNCQRLIAAGFLTRAEVGGRVGRPQILRLAEPTQDLVFPYRGVVRCGGARAPEDTDGETIDLRKFLKAGDAVFRACGDSMIEAHITHGDLLLVAEEPDPPTGSKIIAMVGDEMLCKRLGERSDRGVMLYPCNAELEPLFVDTEQVEFMILGVLKRIVREV